MGFTSYNARVLYIVCTLCIIANEILFKPKHLTLPKFSQFSHCPKYGIKECDICQYAPNVETIRPVDSSYHCAISKYRAKKSMSYW